jgi:nucleotide-binding universal stress UspA family protein
MAEAAEASFAKLTARPECQGLVIERLSRDGIPAREIIRAAREVEADLVVIGAHGATGLREILYGTTAEGVVRGAPCPVLSVGDGRGHEED